MRKEDEIIPSGLLLFKVAIRYRSAVEERLQNIGSFAWKDLTAMAFLKLMSADKSAISQQDLADACDLDKATVMRIIDRLVHWGFAERAESGRDRRVNLISLTSAGRETAARFLEEIRQIDKEIFRNVDKLRIELSQSLTGLPK